MYRFVRLAIATASLWTYGCLGLTNSASAVAQEAAAVLPPISSRFVPDDAIVVAVAAPTELLANPAFAMLPIEIMRAQAIDRVGIDPMDLALVKVVVGMPGPDGPKVGAVVSLTKKVDVSKLLAAIHAETKPVLIGNRSVYKLGGQPEMVLHQLDETTLLVASANYLEAMSTADKGTGQLPSLVAKMPRHGGLTIVAAMQQIRPMVSGMAMQQAQQLPPPLQPLGQIPGMLDAVLIQSDLNGIGGKLTLTLLCIDDAAAGRVEAILNDSMKAGRAIGIGAMKDGVAQSEESDLVKAATERYANRMADMVTQSLTPSRTGRRVNVTIESSAGIATTGVFVGLLLPAVQAAREASRRMSASNNIKQVMLGLHNYHAAYNRLPAPAITDAQGNSLLSWRVSILPFVEQQALYEQFHLDEPWDSEHNLPLSQQLPAVFTEPSASLPPGHTVIQAVVGDEIGFKPVEKTGFLDFQDGMSNSILVVEAARHAAVPWSKPQDVEIDTTDPLVNMGDSHPGGFQVGFCDGAVRFISKQIDVDQFNALLTRAGGEAVNPDN